MSNQCSICDSQLVDNPSSHVSTRNIAANAVDGRIICVACSDIADFIDDEPDKKPIPTGSSKPSDKSSVSKNLCPCGGDYENNKCRSCNALNPLALRKPKTKKKKRKKKSN